MSSENVKDFYLLVNLSGRCLCGFDSDSIN